jgi:hypothetical protein
MAASMRTKEKKMKKKRERESALEKAIKLRGGANERRGAIGELSLVE